MHRYLCTAFMFYGGKFPALTIHPKLFNGLHYIKSPLEVYSKRVSSDMYMEHCFLAPWALLCRTFSKLCLFMRTKPCRGLFHFQSLPVPYFDRKFAQKPAFFSLSMYHLKKSTMSSKKCYLWGPELFWT